MAIEKPFWLKTGLTWLNWEKGQWVDWWVVVIPPFSFAPGDWIEQAIDWLLVPLGNIADSLSWAWSSAISAVKTATEALGKIDQFIGSATYWLRVQLVTWWSGAFEDVKAWVQGLLSGIIAQVSTLWAWFGGIDDWLKARLAPIYAALEDQLGDRVQPLKVVLDFWILFGSTLLTFLQNPWEWLEGKLEEFLFGREG